LQSATALAELLFGHRNALVWWQECNRAVLVFLYGLVLVRVAGRRVFGKWAALDIIVSIMVGSNLSRALTGGAPLLGTLAATTVMMGLHWVLAHAASRSEWFSALVEGTPLELGRDGRLERERLVASAVSKNDIDEALRQQGVEHEKHTRRVVLEPSGKINVLKAEK
jgi:uncharacterized membrane protein YcaP (DUF421 family)